MATRLFLAICFAAFGSVLRAETVPVSLFVSDGENMESISIDAEVIPGFFSNYHESGMLATPTWELSWQLRGQVHNQNFLIDDLRFDHQIKNTSSVPSTFTITAIRSVPVLDIVHLYGGGLGGGITDLNGGGATLSTLGTPMYMSLIDGADFVPLLPHPNGLTAPPNGSAGFMVADGIGFPEPLGPYSLPGPELAHGIGVRLEFQLSPGDEFRVSGHLGVVQIPEPATLRLFVVGATLLLYIAYSRRERRRLEAQK